MTRLLQLVRGSMLVSAAIDRYLAHLTERSCTQRTLASYRQELELLQRHLASGGIGDVGKIGRGELAEHVGRASPRGAAPSPGTRNRKLTVLRGFFGYLIEGGHLPANPALDLPWAKQPHRERPHLARRDVRKLVRQIPADGFQSTRDATIVLLLFHTGVRIDELLSLNVDQVDVGQRLLVGVRRKGGGHQPLPLNRTAMTALSRWLDARSTKAPASGALFLSRLGKRLSRRAVQVRVRQLGEAAGFGFPVTPHMLRHAFATELLRTGANLEEVRRLLGHRSILTTSRYSHPDQASLRSAVERLSDEKGPKEPEGRE